MSSAAKEAVESSPGARPGLTSTMSSPASLPVAAVVHSNEWVSAGVGGGGGACVVRTCNAFKNEMRLAIRQASCESDYTSAIINKQKRGI